MLLIQLVRIALLLKVGKFLVFMVIVSKNMMDNGQQRFLEHSSDDLRGILMCLSNINRYLVAFKGENQYINSQNMGKFCLKI